MVPNKCRPWEVPSEDRHFFRNTKYVSVFFITYFTFLFAEKLSQFSCTFLLLNYIDCRVGPVATPRSDPEEMSKQKSKRTLFGIRIFNMEVVIVLGLSGEGGKSMVEVLGVFREYLLASS